MKYSKIKFFVLLVVLIISGCANTMEFTKNIKTEDFLFDDNEFQALGIDINKIDSYSKIIGQNKTGFIMPDESKERTDFIVKYPAVKPDEKAYENLIGFTYNNKIGQVLRLSADLDKRTSGFVVDEKGTPISVSNMMVFESNAVVSGALSGGSSQAIASGVSSKSLINPTQGAGANIGAGLVAGLLGGFIHQIQADAAIAGIVSKNNFGARMEEATISAVMPTAQKIDKFGIPSNKSHIIIAPGLVKSIYMVSGKKNFQFKNQVFLISTIAVYRGVEYEKLYPTTNGWDYSITNINMVELNLDVYGEERFKNFRNEISLKKIKL